MLIKRIHGVIAICFLQQCHLFRDFGQNALSESASELNMAQSFLQPVDIECETCLDACLIDGLGK